MDKKKNAEWKSKQKGRFFEVKWKSMVQMLLFSFLEEKTLFLLKKNLVYLNYLCEYRYLFNFFF